MKKSSIKKFEESLQQELKGKELIPLPKYDKEDYNSIYYELKNKIKDFDISKVHYLSKTITSRKNLYSLEHLEFFNNYLKMHIGTHFESIFNKEKFFEFLSYSECYLEIEKVQKFATENLIHNYQETIDHCLMQLKYFTNDNKFYKKYNPFSSSSGFNQFLAKNILQNLRIIKANTCIINFGLLEINKLILNRYFLKVKGYIRDNYSLYNDRDIRLEINRLKSKIEPLNEFSFLDWYIKELDDISTDLTALSDQSVNSIKKPRKPSSDEIIIEFLSKWFSSDNLEEDLTNLIKLNLAKIEPKSIHSNAAHKTDLGRIFLQLKDIGHYTDSDLKNIYASGIIVIEKNKSFLDIDDLKAHKRISDIYSKSDINIPELLSKA